MTERTVLERLTEAFPSEHIGCTTSDHTFRFGPGATIYVRRFGPQVDTARIEVNWSNFLSAFTDRGSAIREVINDRALGVRPHVTQTKVECLFESHNIDSLIEALSSSP